jgi:HprK-related kinase A
LKLRLEAPLSHSLAESGALVEIGPYRYQLVSSVGVVRNQWQALYGGYPTPPPGSLVDFRIGLEAPSFLRRFMRPNVIPNCDVSAPFQPVHRHQGLVALEMAMNWQTALGSLRYLTLHAASIAQGSDGIILPGASGSGKSTLASGLAWQDWRFLSDEFVLLSPVTGQLHPYPRPTSLKNESVAIMKGIAPPGNFSPEFPETHKGTICYVRPPQIAIDLMHETVTPRFLVFPDFAADAAPKLAPMTPEEAFVRLVAGSANYDRMGEASFNLLVNLVRSCPAHIMSYAKFSDADAMLRGLLADRQFA